MRTIPINVSAIFKQGADPFPYKFQYTDSEGERHVVAVDKIISYDKENMAGQPSITYHCQSTMYGVARQYDIRYYIQDCQWKLCWKSLQH